MTVVLFVNSMLAAAVFACVIALLTRAIGRYGPPIDGPGPRGSGQAPTRLAASLLVRRSRPRAGRQLGDKLGGVSDG
jgi:hypothetical protein